MHIYLYAYVYAMNMQLNAFYTNLCNPKYMQNYAFENMQKLQKICNEYA